MCLEGACAMPHAVPFVSTSQAAVLATRHHQNNSPLSHKIDEWKPKDRSTAWNWSCQWNRITKKRKSKERANNKDRQHNTAAIYLISVFYLSRNLSLFFLKDKTAFYFTPFLRAYHVEKPTNTKHASGIFICAFIDALLCSFYSYCYHQQFRIDQDSSKIRYLHVRRME